MVALVAVLPAVAAELAPLAELPKALLGALIAKLGKTKPVPPAELAVRLV